MTIESQERHQPACKMKGNIQLGEKNWKDSKGGDQ